MVGRMDGGMPKNLHTQAQELKWFCTNNTHHRGVPYTLPPACTHTCIHSLVRYAHTYASGMRACTHTHTYWDHSVKHMHTYIRTYVCTTCTESCIPDTHTHTPMYRHSLAEVGVPFQGAYIHEHGPAGVGDVCHMHTSSHTPSETLKGDSTR